LIFMLMTTITAFAFGAENKYLSVGPSADGKGLTVTAKTGGGTKIDLYLTDAKGNIGGKLSESQLKLSDKNFVEVSPAGEALEIRATMRFSFIPEFYGADALFDPTLCKKDLLYVGAENFLIGVNEHKNGVMLVWPSGGKQVQMLAAEGEGEARRFTKMRITFDKKPVYVAVMDHKSGLFPSVTHIDEKKIDYAKAIHPERKSWKYGEIFSGWKFPCDAMWWTVLSKKKEGDETGMSSESYKVDCRRHGWNDVQNTFRWTSTCHKDRGGEWVLELEKKYGPYFCALTYPRTRTRPPRGNREKRAFGYGTTPQDVFTVTDVIFHTLGKENYDKVIGREGLADRGMAPKGEPWVWATCGGSWNLWMAAGCRSSGFDSRLKPNKERFNKTAKGLEYFLTYGLYRVREYRRKAKEAVHICEEAAKKNPKLKAAAERMIHAAHKVEELWEEENKIYRAKVHKYRKKYVNKQLGKETMTIWPFLTDEEIKNIQLDSPGVPEKMREWCCAMYDKYGESDHETMGKLNVFQGMQWKAAGGRMDGVLVFQRKYFQGLRQQAAFAGIDGPEARELALKIRKLAIDTMKYYHYKEEPYSPDHTAQLLGSWSFSKRKQPMTKEEFAAKLKAEGSNGPKK